MKFGFVRSLSVLVDCKQSIREHGHRLRGITSGRKRPGELAEMGHPQEAKIDLVHARHRGTHQFEAVVFFSMAHLSEPGVELPPRNVGSQILLDRNGYSLVGIGAARPGSSRKKPQSAEPQLREKPVVIP